MYTKNLYFKFNKFLVFIFFTQFFLSLSGEVFSANWRELSAEHFIVYFSEDKEFASAVANKAEVYYRRIASELGYPRYSEFWTWENRVKIYIYPSHTAYLKATAQPKWSEGMADYKNKKIISYTWGQGFVESLLPHEIAHLIFRDFVGFKGEIPLWLDEGVAQWSEEARRKQLKAMALHSFNNDSLLLLEDMMKMDIRNITEMDKVHIRATRTKKGEPGVLFMSSENLINAYYLQAASLVGFLIERYGSTNFAVFCRELRDGKTIEQALKSAYPSHLRNLQEFEDRWRQYLSEQQR